LRHQHPAIVLQALVPQDKEEAVANVKTRLEFITAELTRHTKMAGEVGAKKQGTVLGFELFCGVLLSLSRMWKDTPQLLDLVLRASMLVKSNS
jgi:hypothetical protein